MTFQEGLRAIPFTPSASEATGILPTLIRAIGHILYVAGVYADTSSDMPDAEAQNELRHAAAHLATTGNSVGTAPLSTAARAHLHTFIETVNAAANEWEEWESDQRSPNLKDLADRAAAIGAVLDYELLGLRNSDPGRTL